MPRTTTLIGLLSALALAPALSAQLPKPVNGPPWWGVADNDTVSIYWDFNNQAQPFAHHPASVVPAAWPYVFGPNDGFTAPAPITWLPTVTTHTGVLGFTGNGTPRNALLQLTVDNDPRPNWIKVFFFQYDSTATGTEKVSASIRQVFAQYKRVNISETSVALGGGWNRTTINAELLPQPDWEGLDFSMTATALGSVAIDNLFVNSKCVKPPPDETGDALGASDSTQPLLDLQNATTSPRCQAVAVTQDLLGARTYWISSAAAPAVGSPHQVFRIDGSGTTIGAAVPVGTFTAGSPFGLTALTTERVSPVQSFVHGVRDDRIANGRIDVVSINATTGAIAAVAQLQVAGLALPPAPHRFGLTFFAPGDNGAGSFWLVDNQDQPGLTGSAYEFSRSGALLAPSAGTTSNLQNRLPRQTVGAGYDELTGMLYFLSAEPRTTPLGITRTNGVEFSAYDYLPTGAQFFGDLTLPDPLGPGGTAVAMSTYRRINGDWRAVCIANVANRAVLYELKGPFRFGWNAVGSCGMRGDPPMRGSTAFQVTLDGVPNATGAILYAGFSNQLSGTTPLPFNLGFVGLQESNLSVSLDLNSVFLPVANGSVAYTVPMLPAGVGPANVPLFFQWIVFDPTLPGGLATSQAGKTVIY